MQENKGQFRIQKYNFLEILEKYQLNIPRYQRKYSWENKEWNDLLESIKLIISKEIYLGNMILHNKGDTFDIVDGQQRITTLFVLFCVMYKNTINGGIKNTVESSGIVYTFLNISKEFLKSANESENDTLISLVNIASTEGTKTPKKKRLEKCFDYFSRELSNENIEELYKKLKSTVFSLTITENMTDAINIFITMNTKGKPLKKADVIKSKIMEKNNNAQKQKLEEIELNKIWEEIEVDATSTDKNIGDKTDDFLWFYLNSINSHDISSAKILEEFDSKIDNHDTIIPDLLKEIKLYSEIYKNILKPNKDYWGNIFESIISIKEMGFKQLYPLIGFIKAKNTNLEIYLNLINDLLLFMFRVSTIKGRYGTKPRNFILNVKKLLFKNDYKSYKKDPIFTEEINDNDKFYTDLEEKKYLENKVAKFILKKYYSKKSDFKTGMFKFDKITLEHIIDQSVKIEDFSKLDNRSDWEKQWIKEIQKPKEERDFIYKLGNMTLLTEKNNQKASKRDKDWTFKMQIYWGTETDSAKALLNKETNKFSKQMILVKTDDIIERTKYLINEIRELKIFEFN